MKTFKLPCPARELGISFQFVFYRSFLIVFNSGVFWNISLLSIRQGIGSSTACSCFCLHASFKRFVKRLHLLDVDVTFH